MLRCSEWALWRYYDLNRRLFWMMISRSDFLQSFTLEFHFEPNEYFTNTVLTKVYKMKSEPDADDPFSFEGPEIIDCEGWAVIHLKQYLLSSSTAFRSSFTQQVVILHLLLLAGVKLIGRKAKMWLWKQSRRSRNTKAGGQRGSLPNKCPMTPFSTFSTLLKVRDVSF